jgi:hypothetical protein
MIPTRAWYISVLLSLALQMGAGRVQEPWGI